MTTSADVRAEAKAIYSPLAETPQPIAPDEKWGAEVDAVLHPLIRERARAITLDAVQRLDFDEIAEAVLLADLHCDEGIDRCIAVELNRHIAEDLGFENLPEGCES